MSIDPTSAFSITDYLNLNECNQYLNIENDKVPLMESDKDLLVGKNIHVELKVGKGNTLNFKNIVVIGTMTVKSAEPKNNMEESAKKGCIIAKNLIVVGLFDLTGVDLTCDNCYVAESPEKFRKELEDAINKSKIQKDSSI
jgi:hypothetical protein